MMPIANLDPKYIEKLTSPELDLLLENMYIDKSTNVPLYVYNIYEKNKYKKIGRITIRLGFNEEIFYLGNIGYSIAKNFRGNNYAEKSCQMLIDLLKQNNIKGTILITVNPLNIASKKTCENLGAVLLDTVHIPTTSIYYAISDNVKDRYAIEL